MYPQYLQRLLRTEAHTDTAYLAGVVVRVRNKTPSFRASFDALFTLATLDNGTTVYTHTPARPATFRADVAALLRDAAARGHVSEAVVVGALSGNPAPKPAKPASKPGERGALSRLVRHARRSSDAMPGTHVRPMCACCSVVQILTIACAEPGVDQAGAMHDAAGDAMDSAADDAMHDAADDAMNKDAVLERKDAQADAVVGAVGVAAGGAAGGGYAVPVDNGTGRSKAGSASVAAPKAASGGSAPKKVRTSLCVASVRVMARVL
jgi:hypothetical protein